MVLVALCKYAYIPLLLSAVVLYPKIASRTIRRVLPFAATLLLSLAAVFVALRGYGSLFEKLLATFRFDAFFSTLVATTVQEGGTVLWQFAGGNLGWPYMNFNDAPTTVRIPLCWIAYLVVLILAFLASFDPKASFKRWERGMLIVLSAIETLLIFVALLEGKSDGTAVTWLQGRYFIPPAFMAFYALMFRADMPPSKLPILFFGVAMAFVNVASIGFVINFFW